MFTKILIANRGEIACRIIKTCRILGVQTVAIYSSQDKNSLFVKQADEAFHIGSNDLADSYLNIDKIIKTAKQSNCQAIHPGYGFLSENSDFANKCEKNNLIFIGPSAKCIELMGCKKKAKEIMQKAGVPVVPGFNVNTSDEAELLKQAQKLGYPVLIKATSGGGGKGMKLIHKSKVCIEGINSANREALKNFANDQLLVEKYLAAPRHIEVQVFADNHENIIHLFERDCSIQRRHQKIIEEAPAINIKDDVRKALHTAAIKAAKTVNYSGAGTIEFLLEDNKFYFMEMNTRLQVEHGVTELITNLDLVEMQLQVASNEPLNIKQQEIICFGHATEVRLYAEDPDNQFLPQTGILEHCQWPNEKSEHRIDTGVMQNDEISVYYDPMIAKILGFGETRQAANQKLYNALQETQISGITTNLSFLKNILQQKSFQQAKITTHYIENNPFKSNTSPEIASLYLATYIQLKNKKHKSPWHQLDNWQANLPSTQQHVFNYKDQVIKIELSSFKNNSFSTSSITEFENYNAQLIDNNIFIIENNNKHIKVKILKNKNSFEIISHDACYRIKNHTENYDTNEQNQGSLNAPMPGTVISIACQSNQVVNKNQVLMIIEAMKMEHKIISPFDAMVEDIFFTVGSQVNEGETLLALKESCDS